MVKPPKKMGRPAKAAPTQYANLHIPLASKKELDAIREKIEAQVGFHVSFSDAILHLIKMYANASKGGKA